MQSHDTVVAGIAATVRTFYDRQQPFRIYHGSTNSTRQSQYRRDNIVDTSNLNNILRVDKDQKTVLVEPNVPMDKLVEGTMAHGLVPLVVMEFPGITVGGGFSGTSGESSSFRHGFFDRTVNWIEIILPNGDLVTASHSDKPDLFWGAAAAFGTLGVVSLVEIRLMEAKKYVELTYHSLSTMPSAIEKIQEVTKDTTIDYLDGMVLTRDRIVICSGRLTDDLPAGGRIQKFTRATDPWFYMHTEKRIANATEPIVDYIPLVDYLFRYDRGGFWVGKYAFKYFITPFNRVSRYLLDTFMHTRVMYHALHQSGHSKRYIIQDVAVPYEATDEFLHWLNDEFSFYPLWLCPLRQRGQFPGSAHGLLAETADDSAPEYLMNFGVWGPGSTERRQFVQQNRKLELKVQDMKGKKWLYAHAYYTEDEFWTIYGRKEYDLLRTKYHATYLPTIYDKVKVDVESEERVLRGSLTIWLLSLFWDIWPLSGLFGVYKAWRGGGYLLQKERTQQIMSSKRGD
jgi:delta24-sterol reductase